MREETDMTIVTEERLVWLWIIGAMLNFTGTAGTLIGILISLIVIAGWIVIAHRHWKARNENGEVPRPLP